MIDYKYLSLKVRSAKKRRLMTTPVFDGFATSCVVESAHEGSKPVFVTKKNYDSRGFEKKEPVKPGAEPENQSFFSKYWMYILMAFFILPRLFEAPEGEGGSGGGGGGQSQA